MGPSRTGAPAKRRVRARVYGTVQGVGFRPFVHRLAGEGGLSGWVLNDVDGVLLELEGDGEALDLALRRLGEQAPVLADVERVAVEEIDPLGEAGFSIAASPAGGEPAAPVSPDSATCEDCLRELLDPADRRFRYPFVNCTNCGPRFTIVHGVPYDRPLTTMAGFAMCALCRAEYEDPSDRRFHAQPNACADCGPSVRLVGADGGPSAPASPDPVTAAAAALAAGAVLAVKGLGGYHLACRADHEGAVAALRARKHREDKPFALMAASAEVAHALVELDARAEALLCSRARPIVLAPRRAHADVAAAVAPASAELGLMLAYSPLHHLLLSDLGVALGDPAATLVMTSGNVSDEPIAYRDEDALERLARVADAFLLHDRPIATRTDDSVARVAGPAHRPLLLRRSRGYAPAALSLSGSGRPLLACGAETASTFCVAKRGRAWVSHHIGDLKNWETLRSFREGVRHFERLFAVEPQIVAHDLHPDYLSTGYALEREGVARLGVQHHHAHLAATLAEHGEEGPAVGAIFDGTGLGTDGSVWGGELLVGGAAAFERAGHLRPVPMPGGERSVREPWRMACAWLLAAFDGEADPPAALRGSVDPVRWEQVTQIARGALASPSTTSAGRLFDAVSALCGVRATVTYEGQAAVELEAAADPGERAGYPLPLLATPQGLVLDARETVRALSADAAAGARCELMSARFHNGLAAATAKACARIAEERGLGTVVLSGGVFGNRLLLERTAAGLERAGLRVLVPERLPPGDGGLAYGQAAVASAVGPALGGADAPDGAPGP